MGHYASEMGYPPERLSDEEYAEIERRTRAALDKIAAEDMTELALCLKGWLAHKWRQRVAVEALEDMVHTFGLSSTKLRNDRRARLLDEASANDRSVS